MNRFPFQVIGFEHHSIELQYVNSETFTAQPPKRDSESTRSRKVDAEGRTISVPFLNSKITETQSEQVTIRVRDLAEGLRAMAQSQLAWIEDLGDDPIVITTDFYEVFQACKQARKAG